MADSLRIAIGLFRAFRNGTGSPKRKRLSLNDYGKKIRNAMNIGTTWEKFDRLLEDRKQKERLREKREKKLSGRENYKNAENNLSRTKHIIGP